MEQLEIRPYARLLTMLGDQLIKNERIALVELIKNSYDADADWVKVTFVNFDKNFKTTPTSKIIIEDNGTGMTEGIIRDHWLNPATPEKKKKKKNKSTTRTTKGRILQGEKGIGRFAMLKLGKDITIYTRAESDSQEHIIRYDFSEYDEDFDNKYLNEISIEYDTRNPEKLVKRSISLGTQTYQREPHGTIIEISKLKMPWGEQCVKGVASDAFRLQSIFGNREDFEVYFYRDNEHLKITDDNREKLENIVDNNAVIRITEGKFDAEKMTYKFNFNGISQSIDLLSPEIMAKKAFRERFGNLTEQLPELIQQRMERCGSFSFLFYIFDISRDVEPRFKLDNDDKKLIKEHRTYLYRDGIRVYPYGDPEDDWLQIDKLRGTSSAGSYFSNDQLVGCINISCLTNPELKDKTNREGLIDAGGTTGDFIALIQTILAYIHDKYYNEYRINLKKNDKQNAHAIIAGKKVERGFETIEKNIKTLEESLDVLKTPKTSEESQETSKHDQEALEKPIYNKQVQSIVQKTRKNYQIERAFLTQRAETTEDLAGVGLSVETASHDMMLVLNRAFQNLQNLIKDLNKAHEIDKELLLEELGTILDDLTFICSHMKNIQLLFKSSKRKRRNIPVREMADKVANIYRNLLSKESIELQIEEVGSPLTATTTEGVLLQVILNLMDNAVFWLKLSSNKNRIIRIIFDGTKKQMIFSDNGPGIDDSIVPYIFEPFYSGKGEAGRGLGLYIARQLLERHLFSIDYISDATKKALPGANFIVDFNTENKNG